MSLKIDYLLMFNQAVLNRESETEAIVYSIKNNQNRYLAVEQVTKIPWYVISMIHSLECGLNFNCHLHNGDSLTERTIHVPIGRPINGEPPFTWEESAIDALSEVWVPKKWDISGSLEFIERYNGLGYAMRGVNTPYLWSATSLYTKGLFVSDDEFNADAVSKAIGAAALMKVMIMKGYIYATSQKNVCKR